MNPTQAPIEQKESIRWLENLKRSTDVVGDASCCIHIGDRESDIYELFCAPEKNSTKFFLRMCVDRLAEDGQRKI